MKKTLFAGILAGLLCGCGNQADPRVAALESTVAQQRAELADLKAALAQLRARSESASQADGPTSQLLATLAKDVATLQAESATQKKILSEVITTTQSYIARDALNKAARR